jgi:UDP-glucose 4-epimerase
MVSAMETSPTRWIVTGGTGFLGTNFLHTFRPEDGEVVVISRRPARWPVVRPWIRYLEQDIRDVDSYRHELLPGSIVVHLANTSYPGKAEKVIESDIQDNVLGTIRLAQACANANVRSFLFLSSGGAIYGNQAHVPVREDAACFPISAYGAMKITIEQYLRIIHHLQHMPTAFLRVGNPFGPWHAGLGQGAINVFFKKVLDGSPIEVWGEGEQVRDYIPIQDVSEAIRLAGMSFSEGCEAFNIGTGEGRSLNAILHDIETVTGTVLDIQRKPAREVDVATNILDSSKFQERFGWKPSASFEDSLRATWEWARTTHGQ